MGTFKNLLFQKRRFLFQLFIVFLTVFPIILVAIYGYYAAQKNITEATLSKREAISYLAATTLEERFDHIIDIEKLEVSRPEVITAIKAKKWNDAILLISSIRRDFPLIDRIILEDSRGIFMADNPHITPSLIGNDYSYAKTFQLIKSQGKPYVGVVTLRNAEPRINVVPVGLPIMEKPGSSKLLAVLFFQVPTDKLLAWSRSLSSSGQGSVYFVDQNGEVVGHPLYELPGKHVNYSALPPVKKVLSGKRGVGIYYNPIEKTTNLTAYFPVNKYGWGALVTENVASAFALRKTELNRIIFIFTFAIVMAVILLLFVFRYSALLGFSQAKERVLLESIGDGIFAINKKRKITLWNKAAEKITGWSYAEVIGREYSTIIKFVEEETHDDAAGYIEQVLRTGQLGEMKLHTLLVVRDGREIPVGDSAAPIFGTVGKQVEGVIVVFRDVSEQRKLEYAKDEFVSLAAHQLRTPLGIIRWSIEALLKKKTISQPTKEALVSILESDMGLIGSVNDILSVTHINQGKIECKAQMTVIVKEIEITILKLTPLAKKQSVELKLASKDNSSKAEIDPKLFSEVLNNVLSNAIKYSKKNGTITISLENTKDTFEIKVMDEGIGIPQEDIERVFQKFSRAKNAGKSGAEGTGLGLFIAKQYLSAMKGSIRLESIEGKGTQVYITLRKHLTGDN